LEFDFTLAQPAGMQEGEEIVQLNEEILVEEIDLQHLKHIQKRVKNVEAVTKMVVKHIKHDNYLAVISCSHASTSSDNCESNLSVEGDTISIS
jgi:hypothetical protein